MKKRLLYTILSISLLTVMAGVAIANGVVFTKEMSWKVDFSTDPVRIHSQTYNSIFLNLCCRSLILSIRASNSMASP